MHRSYLPYILINILLLGCNPPNPEEKKSEVQKSQVLTVETKDVKLMELSYFIQSTGKIKATNEQKVFSESSGTIKSYRLKNSMVASAGSILLVLDTKALQIKINAAKESIFSSKLSYQSDLLSQESLLKNKSRGIKDTVYRKLRSSVGLTDSELELKGLELEMQNAIIRAPFSGRIASVKVQDHQFIKNGDELFTIYTQNDLILETKVLETDIANLKIGQKADIIPISGNRKFAATITDINPLVDENGLVNVRLKILNTNGLLPGMNATCSIHVPSSLCIAVPKQAVIMRNGKAVIFTIEGGQAKWNYVVLGKDNGLEVEVKDGLKVGQKAIISNNVQISNGALVKEDI